MKKVFSIIAASLCACTAFPAMAATDGQFVNPIISVDTISGGATVQLIIKSRCEYDETMLSQDTTIQFQPMELSATMTIINPNGRKWTDEQKQEIYDKYYDYNMLFRFNDVYEHANNESLCDFNSIVDMGLMLGSFGATKAFGYAPRQAGHHKWLIAKEGNDTLMSGKVVLEREPHVSVVGGNGENEINESQSFDVVSKIKSGFPYNVENFQGKVHYKIFAPDSTVVFEKDLQLNAPSDSILLEYIQIDTICRIECAKKGSYVVELTNAPWIEGGKGTYMIWVMDPFMGARSDYPKDVTLVVKNSTFKDNFDGWSYEGPERHEIATNDDFSAVMVGSPAYDPREQGFNLEQTIDSVPAGWYKLEWNGYYQPGSTAVMKYSNPVLAEIFGEDQAQQLAHVYDAPLTEENDDFIQVMIPKDANSALKLIDSKYSNGLVFEHKKNGPLTIGARAQASDIYGATTVVGRPKLTYYGEGKAYGQIVYSNEGDTIFAPKDTIRYQVNLVDGVGVAVPDSNKVWINVYKNDTFTPENLVLDSVYSAGKAGFYELEFCLPDSADFKPGKYYINAGTLHNGQEYEAELTTIIELKFKDVPSAINEASEDPRKSNSRTYDLSGRRVNPATIRKGNIYIKEGKKRIK